MYKQNEHLTKVMIEHHSGKWNDDTRPDAIKKAQKFGGLTETEAVTAFDCARLHWRLDQLVKTYAIFDDNREEDQNYISIPEDELTKIADQYGISKQEVLEDLECESCDLPIEIVTVNNLPDPKPKEKVQARSNQWYARRKFYIHNKFTNEYSNLVTPVACKLYNYFWNRSSKETLSIKLNENTILEANGGPKITRLTKANGSTIDMKEFKPMSRRGFYRALAELKKAELMTSEKTKGATKYVVSDISGLE